MRKKMDVAGQGLMTIPEAAEFLRIAPGTLKNWICQGKFTVEDGLTYAGGRALVVGNTVRLRVKKGLLAGGRRKSNTIKTRQ